VYKLFESLFEEEKEIHSLMQKFAKSKMTMTKDAWKNFNDAKCCYICNEKFTKQKFKVRDHNHITDKYRGAACTKCNLGFKLSTIIPVIFHNLKGYDMHLLLQEVGRFKRELTVIPCNMEKYMSFSIGTMKKCWDYKKKEYVDKLKFDLRFIDSFQFMPTSLSNLVDNLKKEGLSKFKYLKQEIEIDENVGVGNTHDLVELLTRKGVHPYTYMDSWEKFDIPTKKLRKEHFRNDLTGDEISDDDYLFYNLVCKLLKLKTLRYYHDLYLKTDVLLLADVFENFRKLSLENYGIDAAHFITTPGLAMCAALKHTNVHLELLRNIDMLNFFEGGIRGGVSCIMNRYSKANIPSLPDYDKSKPNKYIMYLDMN